ncbi:MAG: hypothetical protein HQL98_03665 [Magnetococcales bacterium]|nr:hypothetical protein [Magnetococcales bacterium]
MSRGFGGVTRHEVRLDGAVPVAVSMTLGHGVEAEVDLVTRVVTQRLGPPLKPKQSVWVLEIAEFLARQHLLEAAEIRREQQNQTGGQATIAFEPRLKPDMIWWG